MSIVAAVLSGGKSVRMGSDKAGLEVSGRPLADWVRRALDGLPTVFLGGGGDSLPDAPGSGPTAGLATALAVDAEAVLVVAVDQPWLRSETAQALIDRYDGSPVVPVDDGVRQVTCAVYPTVLRPVAARLASDERALQAVLDEADVDEVGPPEWRAWGEDGRSWFGVNTPEDVDEGLARFGPPGGMTP